MDVDRQCGQDMNRSPQQVRNDAILPPTLSSDRTYITRPRLAQTLQISVDSHGAGREQIRMLSLEQIAPELDALLEDGSSFRLSEIKGKKNVVIYFYPKDFTKS
jgi:hypothetical protein